MKSILDGLAVLGCQAKFDKSFVERLDQGDHGPLGAFALGWRVGLTVLKPSSGHILTFLPRDAL